MKPLAILTGDIHVRDDQPVCRTDDFFEAQAKKIAWLRHLQQEHDCPILDSGDLFAKAKPSHFLIQWAILNLPAEMFTIPGNHDLPSHNLDLLDKSGLGVLRAAAAVQVLLRPFNVHSSLDVYPFPWGAEPSPLRRPSKSAQPRIALCHVMTYQGAEPWPGCKDSNSFELLKKMVGYDLVLTGHNHRPFVEEYDGRLLVNPGSLMRSNADQIDFKPRVYLWYGGTDIEAVYVPIEKDVITRDHIDVVNDRDKRIDAFVSRLSTDFEISLSFEKNLEEFFSANRVRQGVKDIVWSAVKGEK